MAADTFPWSSSTNYSAGPNTGTATKVDPGYNQMTNLVPVGAQAMNFLLNERDVDSQQRSLGWGPAFQDAANTSCSAQAAVYCPSVGLWALAVPATSVGGINIRIGHSGDNPADWVTSATLSYGTVIAMSPFLSNTRVDVAIMFLSDSTMAYGSFTPAGGFGSPNAISGAYTCGDMLVAPTTGYVQAALGSGTQWVIFGGATSAIQETRAVGAIQTFIRNSGAQLIAIGDLDSTYYTSSNGGATWVAQSFPSGMQIGTLAVTGIDWHSSIMGSFWVLTAGASAIGANVWVSSDGISWTRTASLTTLFANIGRIVNDLRCYGRFIVGICDPVATGQPDSTMAKIILSADGGQNFHMTNASLPNANVGSRLWAGDAVLAAAPGIGGINAWQRFSHAAFVPALTL